MVEAYYSLGLILIAVCGAILFVLSERRMNRARLRQMAGKVKHRSQEDELAALLGMLENVINDLQNQSITDKAERTKHQAFLRSVKNAVINQRGENRDIREEVSLLEARIKNLEFQKNDIASLHRRAADATTAKAP